MIEKCVIRAKEQKASSIFDEAVERFNNEDFDAAKSLFRKAVSLTQSNELIQLCYRNISACDDGLKIQEAYRVMESGDEYFNLEQFDNAISCYKRAMSMTASSSLRIACEDNIKSCYKAIENKRNEEAYEEYEAGIWDMENENYTEARWHFEKALDLCSSSAWDFRRTCENAISECRRLS